MRLLATRCMTRIAVTFSDAHVQNDPLRRFYTSLLSQRPDSEMALKWCVGPVIQDDHPFPILAASSSIPDNRCMQNGCLEEEEAHKAFKKLGKGGATPVKSSSAAAAVKREGKPKAAADAGKRARTSKVKYEDLSDDDDDEDEKPLSKRKPAAAAAPKRKAATKKDVEGDEDDDDVPLSKIARPKRPAKVGTVTAAVGRKNKSDFQGRF